LQDFDDSNTLDHPPPTTTPSEASSNLLVEVFFALHLYRNCKSRQAFLPLTFIFATIYLFHNQHRTKSPASISSTSTHQPSIMSDTDKPVIVTDPTKGVRLNASDVAKPFRDEIKAKVESMKAAGLGT
jgi:hypothetical protein